MTRFITASLLTLTFAASAVLAQDGPLRRAGQALDRTGKNIRARVETEVARGEIAVQEREILSRVSRRIAWDRRFVGSTIQIESRAGGVIVLRGSVLTPDVKLRAVEQAANTIGVTSVVDELGVVKGVKVIKAKPPETVIEVAPPATAPAEVIVKPRAED